MGKIYLLLYRSPLIVLTKLSPTIKLSFMIKKLQLYIFLLFVLLFATMMVLSACSKSDEQPYRPINQPGLPADEDAFHVTVSGKSSGTGSLDSPWDLQTALDHHPSIKPGATIYIHDGTYRGAFISALTGTAEAPIIVRARPNGTVIIDNRESSSGASGAIEFWGSYTWIIGLTITNSNANHQTPHNGADGVFFMGNENKLLHCIIHNNEGNGIGFWSSSVNSEVSGCIIFHNGYIGPTRGHGHGLYVQNNNPAIKSITDNMIFNSFGKGMQIYGTSVPVRNVLVEGNTIFNTGLGARSSPEQGVYAGGERPVSNILVNNNAFYFSPRSYETAATKFGYAEDPRNGYAEFHHNYCVDAFLHITKFWDRISTRNNTYIAKSAARRIVVGYDVYERVDIREYDNNTYYRGEIGENGANGFTHYSLSAIQSYGQELNSAYYNSLPVQNHIILRSSRYEAGRAFITIYNWEGKTNAAVDISSVLNAGDKYALYDVTSLSTGPVLQGTYGGGAIEVPMNLTTVDKPLNLTDGLDRFKNTAPDFGAFMLLKIW